MVNGISSRVHRSATSEIPRWIFLHADHFREPVLFPTLQPSRELTVTDVGRLIFHVRIMHTTPPLVNDLPSGSVCPARERGAETPFDGRRHEPDRVFLLPATILKSWGVGGHFSFSGFRQGASLKRATIRIYTCIYIHICTYA